MELDHLAPLIEAIIVARRANDEAQMVFNAAQQRCAETQKALWDAHAALGEAMIALTDPVPADAAASGG